MPGTVTMYSTTWCGYCRRLKSQMDREGIAYTEINIEQDPDVGGVRREGQRRQPDGADRASFPDGSTLTNPSLAQVKAKVGV